MPPEKPWIEPDDVYEGVGAHRDNPRYDDVDDGEDDGWTPDD